MNKPLRPSHFAAVLALAAGALAVPAPALAQYNQYLRHDAAKCRGEGPAIRVTVNDVKSSQSALVAR